MAKMCPRSASVDESDVDVDSASQTGCFQKCLSPKQRKVLAKFYAKISHPKYFLLLNALCIVQTIPALFYYISFFQKGFYLINSPGMAPVWGCTIGAIATVVATGALLPIPSAVSSTFCKAVVLWEFLVSGSLFTAAVCLALLSDFHGFAWSLVGSIITGFAACFLVWLDLRARSRLTVASVVEKPTKNVVRPSSALNNFGSDCNSIRSYIETKNTMSDLRLESVMESRSDSKKYYPTGDDSDNEKSSAECGDLGRLFTHGIQAAPKDIPGPVQNANDVPVKVAADDAKEPRCMTALVKCSRAAFQLLLWTVLLVFSVVPVSFGVEQVLEVIEHKMFRRPGTMYLIPSSENSTVYLKMQIHCRGAKAGKPLIILESDTGTSGFSLYNLHRVLGAKWRVCLYDRGGYGWSSLPPFGSSSFTAITWRLNRLLQAAEEGHLKEGLILVGHGEGGAMMQAYAHRYPEQVSGLALIDGYPSIERLRGHSTRKINSQTSLMCGNLQILRTVESLAILRAAKNLLYFRQPPIDGDSYFPLYMLDTYLSTRTNGRYWSARFGDLCVNAGAQTAFTDYLNSVTSPVPAVFKGNEVAWPSIPTGKPVLILSAGETVHGDNPDSPLYLRQATLYNQTLSPSGKHKSASKWIICESCAHSMATDSDSTDVATSIDKYFSTYFPKIR